MAPEALIGTSWAKKSAQAYVARGVRPPLREVLHAYAGGAIAGNLWFWIPAGILGFFLTIATLGAYIAVLPVALAVTLAVQGAIVAQRGTGNQPGAAGPGALVGLGIAAVIVALFFGILFLVAAAFSRGRFGFDWFIFSLASIPLAIWLIVRGWQARQGPLRPQGPQGPPTLRMQPPRPGRP